MIPAAICSAAGRDASTIAVVEEPLDVMAIERTGIYQGRYHVLHGAISPVDGIGPDDLKIRQLAQRVQAEGTREVIIATNPGMEGDATAMYLQRELAESGVADDAAGARPAHWRRFGIRRFGDADAGARRTQSSKLRAATPDYRER